MAELNDNEILENEELLNYISVRRLRDFYLGLKDKLNKIEDMPDLGKLLITLNENGVEKQFLVDREPFDPPQMVKFSPASGTSGNGGLTITLSCDTSDVTYRYTTDGTDPDVNVGQTTNPFTLPQVTDTESKTYVVKAVAVKNGKKSETIASANYTVNRMLAAPTISNPTGTEYDTSRNVTLTNNAVDGVRGTLSYSTDGGTTWTTPTLTNNQVTISITSTCTLQVKVEKSQWVSNTVSKSITIGSKYTHAGLSDSGDVTSGTASTLLSELTILPQGGVKKPSPAGKYDFATSTSAKYIWFAVPRNYSITEIANGAVPQAFTLKLDDTTGGYKYYRLDGKMGASQTITLTVTA